MFCYWNVRTKITSHIYSRIWKSHFKRCGLSDLQPGVALECIAEIHGKTGKWDVAIEYYRAAELEYERRPIVLADFIRTCQNHQVQLAKMRDMIRRYMWRKFGRRVRYLHFIGKQKCIEPHFNRVCYYVVIIDSLRESESEIDEVVCLRT